MRGDAQDEEVVAERSAVVAAGLNLNEVHAATPASHDLPGSSMQALPFDLLQRKPMGVAEEVEVISGHKETSDPDVARDLGSARAGPENSRWPRPDCQSVHDVFDVDDLVICALNTIPGRFGVSRWRIDGAADKSSGNDRVKRVLR